MTKLNALVIDSFEYNPLKECFVVKNEDKIVGEVLFLDEGIKINTNDPEIIVHFNEVLKVAKIDYENEQPSEVLSKFNNALDEIAKNF